MIRFQKLGQEFYQKEKTKPLFNVNKILNVYNLYNYQILNSTYKIIKLRTPISMFSCFNVSTRKETLLHLPKIVSDQFFYKAASIWNKFISCPEGFTAKHLLHEIGNILSLKVRH